MDRFALKEGELTKLFSECTSTEERYHKIIELGKNAPPFPQAQKISSNLVPGCQSLLYLHSSVENGHILWQADSDALISKGLAQLLIYLYQEQTPEVVLKCPPLILTKLGIDTSLSPNRAQGLQSLYLKMKQRAINYSIIMNG